MHRLFLMNDKHCWFAYEDNVVSSMNKIWSVKYLTHAVKSCADSDSLSNFRDFLTFLKHVLSEILSLRF